MPGAKTGIEELPYQAAAAVIAHRFVKGVAGNSQQCTPCTVAGEEAIGVAATSVSASNFQGTNEVTAGKVIRVQALGIAWVEAGAVVAVGDIVATDNVGRAVPAVATNTSLGICRKGGGNATPDGTLILVDLRSAHRIV